MELWFAAVLGLIQGLTEFIPVSSTGHLRIAPSLLGQPDPGAAFSAVIQLGTLAAVLVYFARDVFVDMPRAVFTSPRSGEARLPWAIVIGSVPIVVAGLTLKDFITGDARSLYVVSGALIVVGAILIAADRRQVLTRTIAELTITDGVIIGVAQAFALIPGTSRSGATIIAALLIGFRRPDAARFSFLLGIPAIAGAGLFELRDALEAGGGDWPPLVVGTLVSAISGYAAIAWLMQFLKRRPLSGFGVYRIALGAVLIGLCLAGIVAPLP